MSIALVMGAVLGIACDGHQGAPTAPGWSSWAPPPGPTVTSLTISGNTSISDPGVTTQLTATARYADDSTRDVTAEARWRSSTSDPFFRVVRVISPGLIRAERYGTDAVRATYTSGGGTAPADTQVRVAPEGVFLVTVAVNDHGYATDGARVQVTSPAGTFDATTQLWGVVCLPALGNAMVQVEKAGFHTLRESVNITSDQIIDLVLQPSDAGS